MGALENACTDIAILTRDVRSIEKYLHGPWDDEIRRTARLFKEKDRQIRRLRKQVRKLKKSKKK